MRSERILGGLDMSFSEWREVKLEDIIEIEMGQSPKSEFYNQTGEGLPFLQGNRTFGDKYPYFDTYCTENKKIANKNDVIMSVRAPVGDLNIAQTQISLGRGVCAMRLKGEQNSNYLFYLMKHNIKEMINRESGTVFGSVNKKDILGLDVKITNNKLEQKAIAHILSTLDDKIEVNNQINKTLENMAQAIFKQWFVDFEFPNEDGEPYKSSGGEMVESELGMIPKGWEVRNLKEIADMKNGVNYGRDQEGKEIKVVNVRDFDGAMLVNDYKLDKVFLSDKQINDYLLSIFDTIVVRSAKPGETLLVMNELDKVYSGFTIRVRAKEDQNKIYLFNCLRRGMEVLNNSSNGTVFKNLNQQILGSLKINLPHNEIINKFNRVIKPLFRKINHLMDEIVVLIQIRDILLPKLMSGEIRVPLKEEGEVS
jgi:type I restriction enzyme S subunit